MGLPAPGRGAAAAMRFADNAAAPEVSGQHRADARPRQYV